MIQDEMTYDSRRLKSELHNRDYYTQRHAIQARAKFIKEKNGKLIKLFNKNDIFLDESDRSDSQ